MAFRYHTVAAREILPKCFPISWIIGNRIRELRSPQDLRKATHHCFVVVSKVTKAGKYEMLHLFSNQKPSISAVDVGVSLIILGGPFCVSKY
jgi:hypothetical protein